MRRTLPIVVSLLAPMCLLAQRDAPVGPFTRAAPAKWQVSFYRGSLSSDLYWQCFEQFIPLVRRSPKPLMYPAVVTLTRSTPDALLELRLTHEVHTSALQAHVRGNPSIGSFSGTLTASDDTATKTDLTVIVKDDPLLAVIVILFGVAAALVSQRYFGVQRSVLVLDARIARLTNTLVAAQQEYEKRRGGPFSIVQAVAEAQATLQTKLRAAPRPVFGGWDEADPAYSALVVEIVAVEDAIAAWPEFASDQRSLRLIVEAHGSHNHGLTKPARGTETPAALLELESAAPHPDSRAPVGLAFAEVKQRRARISAMAPFLADWVRLCHMAGLARDALKAIELALNGPNASTILQKLSPDCALPELRKLLDQVNGGLWRSETSAELAASQAATLLAKLNQCLDPVLSLSGFSMTKGSLAEGMRSTTRGAGATSSPVLLPPGLDMILLREIRQRDIAFAIAAFLIAVLGWLNASYLDKPFGTYSDYIAAFLWGYAIKSGLEAFQLAVNRIQTLPRSV